MGQKEHLHTGATGELSEQREEHHSGVAPRWLAFAAALLFGLFYAILPPWLTIGPNWLPLALEGGVLLVVAAHLVLARIRQRRLSHALQRRLAFLLLAIVTLALGSAVALLILNLPHTRQAGVLLRSAALLWVCNLLVFALWYWEIDGGGPLKRHLKGHQAADFMFPQQAGGNRSGWAPHFMDYLFLAFTTATAFSPTDTMPLTR